MSKGSTILSPFVFFIFYHYHLGMAHFFQVFSIIYHMLEHKYSPIKMVCQYPKSACGERNYGFESKPIADTSGCMLIV